MAEKQRILLHELKVIRAPENDLDIPGFAEVKLYPGQAIGECWAAQITLLFVSNVTYPFTTSGHLVMLIRV